MRKRTARERLGVWLSEDAGQRHLSDTDTKGSASEMDATAERADFRCRSPIVPMSVESSPAPQSVAYDSKVDMMSRRVDSLRYRSGLRSRSTV